MRIRYKKSNEIEMRLSSHSLQTQAVFLVEPEGEVCYVSRQIHRRRMRQCRCSYSRSSPIEIAMMAAEESGTMANTRATDQGAERSAQVVVLDRDEKSRKL